MVILNICIASMFMTALLQKIVSAPYTPDRPSTSSEPIEPDDPKDLPFYYKFLEEHPTRDIPSTSSKTFEQNTLKIPQKFSYSQEGFSGYRKNNIPSTSSTTTKSNNFKISPEVARSLKERSICKKEINAIFNENLSPEYLFKHALTNLTLDDPSLLGYARPYYVSLETFLRKGKIPSVSDYCHFTTNKDNCYLSIVSVFQSETPKQCLLAAFYNLNENILQKNGNPFALDYFYTVRDRFKIDLAPLDTKQRYRKPYAYCDSIIEIPPEELKLNLALGHF